MTTVVNIRHEPYDVYIGRANGRWRLKASPFACPFRLGKDGTRDQIIAKYRKWLHSQPDLVERARRELKGKRLGCWCKPLPCHGDVLVEVIENAAPVRPRRSTAAAPRSANAKRGKTTADKPRTTSRSRSAKATGRTARRTSAKSKSAS